MKILSTFESTTDDKGHFTIITDIKPKFYKFLGSLNLCYIYEFEEKEIKEDRPLDTPTAVKKKCVYYGKCLKLINGYSYDYYIPADKGTKIWVNFYDFD